MKKNGFIATSLIYSFFLIFITLFLSIIADYLQNKVLLNTIEKGIKDEINATMSLSDFTPGDLIVMDNGCTGAFEPSKAYVVVNSINNSLILYSYSLCDNSSNSCDVSEDDDETILTDFNNDIPFANKNGSFYNDIIYTFDRTGDKLKYKVDVNVFSVDKNRNCVENEYKTMDGCQTASDTSNYVRIKSTKTVAGRIKNCHIEDAGTHAIYLDWNGS